MDIPEEVQERWGKKLERFQADETAPPILPYPSLAAMTLAGAAGDKESVMALRGLMRSHPDEFPLDLGPAKCKDLDRWFLDEYVKSGGRVQGMRALEAVWLATDEALHYISPRVGGHIRWAWDSLEVRPMKSGRRFGKATVATPGGTFHFSMGTGALANLLTLYSWSQV
ncbi:MAG TPA: hypothetical protein VI916_12840 [Acidimicrobiia bacterium]|nr:hypothetical protein [Acidimicrobiia bacterium]